MESQEWKLGISVKAGAVSSPGDSGQRLENTDMC